MLDFALTEEQTNLVETVRRFTREKVVPVAAEHDRAGTFPKGLFKEAWEMGLVAPTIPAAYGGAGLTEVDHVLLVEELSYGCSGIQTSLTASTLAATPLLLAGSEAQKKKYLGILTSEPCFAAYALTEPDAGSDAAGIQTRAVAHGDSWVLNGQKVWITNACWAPLVHRLRHGRPGASATRASWRSSWTADAPGVSVGKKEDKMGQRASDTATVILEDVEVTKDQVLAGPGEGFRLAMKTFDRTRPDIARGGLRHHAPGPRGVHRLREGAQDLRHADHEPPDRSRR